MAGELASLVTDALLVLCGALGGAGVVVVWNRQPADEADAETDG